MCGVVGIIGNPKASEEIYQALLLMQHRGQDAAGILSNDANTGSIHIYKKEGLVDSVFNKNILENLPGSMGIGHTRYSTIGKTNDKDIQPTSINFPYGLGLAHNGNIINTEELKLELNIKMKRHVYSNNDSEIMINIISQGLLENESEESFFISLCKAVGTLQKKAKGAYSVVGSISGKGFFAFRDPNGIRPLSIGKKIISNNNDHKNSFCFSSESNVLNYLEYSFLRDMEPGELIYIDEKMNFHSQILLQDKKASCMFEWVYFANPESIIDDKSIYTSRLKAGKYLANKIKSLMSQGIMKPDVVVPVPETARISAISLSENIGVSYRELLIKNRYIQRSFILNDQKSREKAVQRKLSPVSSEIKNKNILLVDDSIVRGTTSKHIIKMIRSAGANKVYFAAACPPIMKPCFYGIDFPFKEKLLAYQKTITEIEDYLGADRVIYLDQNDLKEAIGSNNLCMACLDSEYPVCLDNKIETKRVGNKESF